MAMECWPSTSKRPGILVERDSPSISESSRPVVAHAGQLHRRHDGACRLLAGLFQLDSIATDPALGSRSPPDLYERGLAATVGADQAIAVPAAELHGDVRKKGLGPELYGLR